MKKLFALLLTGIAILSLTACGGDTASETQTMTLSVEGIEITYQMVAEDDIIQTLTQTSTLNKQAYTVADVAAFEASFAEYEAIYSNIEGVAYETQSTDAALVETITMDVSNPDTIKALAEAELLPVDGSTRKLSLSATVETLQEQGWIVVE